jgi:recombination protein RecA
MPKAAESKDKDREKALELAMSQIEKQFGRGAVMRLGGDTRPVPVAAISTGCLPLDLALGIGGIPRGRITEIYGNEASGKTTLALHVIAEAQKTGGIAAFIDVEHALDPIYAEVLGVRLDDLLLSQPDTGEQALDITDMLVRSGAIDVFVLDSVAALVPRVELEGEMGDSHMGLQARLMSKALRKISGSLAATKTAGVFLNQIREKIGIMFGNPEITPGGRALKFWASARIETRRIESLKRGTEVYGSRVRARVQKNKVAPPFRSAEFDLIHGKGISREASVLDMAVEYEVARKTGAFFTHGDTRLGQGRDNAREFLEQHPEVCNEIEKQVRERALAGLRPSAREDDKQEEAGEPR